LVKEGEENKLKNPETTPIPGKQQNRNVNSNITQNHRNHPCAGGQNLEKGREEERGRRTATKTANGANPVIGIRNLTNGLQGTREEGLKGNC